jgi:dihydrofolate reductase
MTRITTHMAMSVDGFTAGPNQSKDLPFGEGDAMRVVRWMLEEPEIHAAERADITSADAYIMGRNMFGPDRGPYDLDWRGWWGEDPPYHAPTFVLGHHERESLEMQGGTTFHFVTGGIHDALDRARAVAGEDGHISIAGGAATVNQYLAAGLIDELHLHVAPVLLGEGERLLVGAGNHDLELLSPPTGTALVTHLHYRIVR